MLEIKESIYTIAPRTFSEFNIKIGVFVVIEANENEPVQIENNVSIGHHTFIEANVIISKQVIIDSYCRISSGTRIGENSQVLYGAGIFENAIIGKRCIIGGEVADRTIIGDDVTFMGKVIHTYRKPGDYKNWDEMEQPSPIIGNNAVVGEEALIFGDIEIGEGTYIGAGERVKCAIPSHSVYTHGQIVPLSKFRGFIEVRQ